MKATTRKPTGSKTASDFELRIEKLVYGGDGLGRARGKVVFVPFAVPGDLLVVHPVEEKKNFIRAVIVTVVEPGPARIQPVCPYFGTCGGCQWQQLDYGRQLETKQRILEELFHHRFPETRKLEIRMQPSPEQYHYRSRARVHIRDTGVKRDVGFYRFRTHEIEDIQMCPLLRPTLNGALEALRHEVRSGEEPRVGEIDIACSEEENKWSSAASLANTQKDLPADTGAALLWRTVGEFKYTVSPTAFFQANDFLAGSLLDAVLGLSSGRGSRAAVDLFCGVGLLSLPLARRFENVTAVDNSELACGLCLRNASEAGLSNVRVICADVGQWMERVSSVAAPGYELIVLDPPRTGAGPDVMDVLREWAPETIIYVSCDPQTLTRDLAVLPPRDYRIDAIEGFDFFPQTYHFETVVRLVRR